MGEEKNVNTAEGNKKSFLSHFVAIGSGTIISMFLSLLTTPIITRIVDPTEYGQMSIFNLYTEIAVMVLCLGLDQALVRFYYEKDDIEYKQALLRMCFWYPVSIAIVLSVVVITLSQMGLLQFEFNRFVVILLCINVIITLAERITILLLRVTYKSKDYAIATILKKIVYIVMAVSLLSIVKKNYFEILCISTLLSFTAPALYAVFRTKHMWKLHTTVELNKKQILSFAVPMIFSMGITMLFQAIDKLSIKRYCSYEAVGIYASAMTLVGIFAIIQTTFNSLWSPMQIEHYTKHPEDTGYIQRANQMITVIMFTIGIGLILVKDLFAVLLGAKYREAAYILPCLIFNPIMYTISETTNAGISKSEKSYLNIYVALGSCIVNFIGNTILVPIYGGKGAAISTGFSYIVFWGLRTVFSNKYYFIDYKIPKFLVLTALTAVYALYNTFYRFNIGSVIGFVILACALFVLYWDTIREMFGILLKRRKKNA